MIRLKRKTPNLSTQLVKVVEILTMSNKLVWRINQTAGARATYIAPKSLVYFDLIRLDFPVIDLYQLIITVIHGETEHVVVLTVDEAEHQPFLEFLWLEAVSDILPDQIPIIV